MLSDIEIAQQAQLEPIEAIAAALGLDEHEIEHYGRYKAKTRLEALEHRSSEPDGKLILITGMTPTPAGEGKTTTTVGLADALRRLGKRTMLAIREPSMGPCFGAKGGAAGGGYAQVVPMEDINLHFTGDTHAVGAAHNLLSAMLDNHLHHGNTLQIDPRRVFWKRVIDMNDRSLRHLILGLGGSAHGMPRESGFEITAASEVMAILCLARDLGDLRERLGKIVAAESREGPFVRAADLKAAGAMAVLLRDALKPNLVQTLEKTPAFVHGGPFGNIAHGCNSLVATLFALKLADYVVTEAGFATDLGAEKFFDIKCRVGGLVPALAVIVASIRALKMHGGVKRENLQKKDVPAIQRGLPNLKKHIENVHAFGIPAVVALNHFSFDTDAEIRTVLEFCQAQGVMACVSRAWAEGGAGAVDLARAVLDTIQQKTSKFRFLYSEDLPLLEKIEAIATTLYGAEALNVLPTAAAKLARYEQEGYAALPVCIAKTQNSLSDDPARLGRPVGFKVIVRDAKLAAGAGFIVVYTGEILVMPGLPPRPAAETIDIDPQGQIVGLF